MINYIVAMLLLLSTTALTGSVFFFLYNRNPKNEGLKTSFGAFAIITGIISLILGLHMITNYPIDIPNTTLYIYNETFGIPFTFFGAITLLIGISMRWNFSLKIPSIFAFFASIFNIRYALNFTEFDLTRNPPLAMSLYIVASITGILLPFYFYSKNKTQQYLGFLTGTFLLILGIIAGFIAWEAIVGHVAEALK